MERCKRPVRGSRSPMAISSPTACASCARARSSRCREIGVRPRFRKKTDGMTKSGSDPDFPVILAHGLWVPGWVMRPLAARLERAGFRCHIFSFLGTLRPMAEHVERLAQLARGVGRAHF